MNRKLDISSLITSHEDIIQNGKSEAAAPQNSLERMMLKARREERREDADLIEAFVSIAKKEILTFRKMAQIGRNVKEAGIRTWAASFLPAKAEHPVMPRKINEVVERQLSATKPFLFIEGVATRLESEKLGLMVGPYFAILATNNSASTILPHDTTLVFTFSGAANGKDPLALRIWKFSTFKEFFKGDSLEASQIGLLPDANDQVSKENGTIQDLFLIAADYMGRAALSKNPPAHVENEWLSILREYERIVVDDPTP